MSHGSLQVTETCSKPQILQSLYFSNILLEQTMPPRRARVAETPKSKSNELAWLPAELWPIVLGEVLKARPMVSSAFDGYWWTKSQDAEKIGKRWGAEAGALMVAIAINDPCQSTSLHGSKQEAHVREMAPTGH